MAPPFHYLLRGKHRRPKKPTLVIRDWTSAACINPLNWQCRYPSHPCPDFCFRVPFSRIFDVRLQQPPNLRRIAYCRNFPSLQLVLSASHFLCAFDCQNPGCCSDPLLTIDIYMPIKLPKAFPRRKSSGNALEELTNPPVEPSFRVFDRADQKSFDGGNTLKRMSQGRPLSAGHNLENTHYLNEANSNLNNRYVTSSPLGPRVLTFLQRQWRNKQFIHLQWRP